MSFARQLNALLEGPPKQRPAEDRFGVAVRMGADTLTMAAAAFLAVTMRVYVLAFAPVPHALEVTARLSAYMFAYLPLAVGLFLAIGYQVGVYVRPRRAQLLRRRLWRLTMVTALSASMSLAVLYFVHLRAVNRGVLLLFWALVWMGAVASRAGANLLRRHYYVEPQDKRRRVDEGSVLVVGGAGYIGSVLVRQLLDAGYRVRVLDNLLFGAGSLAEVSNRAGFELQRGDFRSVETVVEAVRGMGSVIHLGAIVGDPACALDERATLSHNFYATRLLLDICSGFGIRRFLFASTCSVYGAASDKLMAEGAPTNPVSLYAATKLDSEALVLGQRTSGLQPVVLRLATAFGDSPRPRFDLVANLFAAQAVTEGRIRVMNPAQHRPFIHTRDIARAFVHCLEAPAGRVAGEVFNTGSSRINHSIGELGQIIARLVPQVAVETVESESDPRDYRVNFDKIYRLGFDCEVTLEQGMAEIADAFRRGRYRDYRRQEFSNYSYLKEYGLQAIEEAAAPNVQRWLAGGARAAAGRA